MYLKKKIKVENIQQFSIIGDFDREKLKEFLK